MSEAIPGDAEERAAEERARSARRARRMRLVGLLMSVVALALVVVSVDVASAVDIIVTADLRLLVLVLLVIAAQVIVRAWRWRILLPPHADGTPVTVRRAVAPMLVGYLGNAVLPARLGEPIRALLVSRRESLDALAAFGATMLERLIDVTTLAFIGVVASLIVGAAAWVVGVAGAAGFAGLIALGLLMAVGAARLAAMIVAVLVRLGLERFSHRLESWSSSLAAGLDRGRDPGRLAKAVFLSLVAWILDASIFLLVGWSLGLDLTVPQAVLIGAVTVLSTAIPAAPGYVGTFELATTATAVAVGIPESSALALALLVHVITVIPIALAGALALVSIGVRLGSLADDAGGLEHAQP